MVYEIVVVPALTPVTIPAAEIVATAGVELVQTPPEDAFVNAVALLTQTALAPLMALTGLGVKMFTVVANEVAEQPFAPVTVTE